LKDFVTQIGIQQNDPNDPFTKRAAHYAQILVNLTPQSERERDVISVVEDLRKKIPKPEAAVKIHFEVIKGGPPQGKPIAINILGKDFDTLRLISKDIKAMLAEIDGVTDIDDSEVLGKKEVKVLPRSEDLSRLGLSTQDVATTVRAAFAGIIATSNRNLDEDVGVRVRLKESQRDPLEQLKFLDVGNSMGNLIPVSRISDFVVGDSQLLIQHEKYKRVISVGAQVDLEKTTAQEATAIAMKKIKAITDQYPEYTIEFGGENEDTAESLGSLARAFVLAAIMILAILILTFGSLLQPILVLTAIPLGFSGTILGLFLHGKPISFMALLGIIALAGIIVNNSIIIIDFYNSSLKKTGNWKESIIEASTRRLRPIILTSVTTVLGLAPTAYGIGGNDGFVAALALSLGWGLLLGSILTMLIFPALLGLLEGFRQRNRVS
jgi:multidrug efflux pump subunit AcrB